MTKEDKELLLKDLCARLPYNIAIYCESNYAPQRIVDIDFDKSCIIVKPYNKELIGVGCVLLEDTKLYLRPMSSMTDEERKEYNKTKDKYTHRIYPNSCDFSTHTEYSWTKETFDFLNKKHFDYRGLIPMGLAREAPRGMYD